jgi:hypothetical protein
MSVWIFLLFIELVPPELRILRFMMRERLLNIRPKRFVTLSRGDRGLVYIRKNLRMRGRSQSTAAIADQTRGNPTGTQSDFAHLRLWREMGLSARAVSVVAAAGCRSLDEIRALGWHYFRRQENCGLRTLQELSELIGGWPDAPRKYSALVRRASDDVLIAEMRRRGIAAESGEE